MKSKHLCKHISLLLAILMLLPLFAFGVTAEEAEISAAQGALKAEADAPDAKKADLVQGLEAASTIFDYVDKASFVAAGHVERLADEEELNSYVFRNPDGSKTVYFLAEDVKYVSVTGAVTEKKLELVALDGGFTTRSSNVSLALPNDLHRGITLAHGGATVSLAPDRTGLAESASVATSSLFAAVEELEQELVSAPTGISAGRADYQNAFGVGTTLRYTPTLSGVKEDVILDRYRGKNSFSFTLNTGNLSVFNENGRYFIAESAEDEEKIFIGETWVYDSQDHFEKGTLSVTQKSEGVYTLTIGASVDFLTSPDTVYPVYIDPSLTVSYGEDGEGYIEDVTVYSGTPDTNYGGSNLCFVGNHPSYGTARTAIRLTGLQSDFVYSVLHHAFIDSAVLTLRASSGGSSTAANAELYPLESDSWTEMGATWNNIGEYVADSTGDPMAEGALLVNTTMTFDLTTFVRDWKIDNAHYPNTLEQGFLMVSSNESIQKRICSSEIATSSYKPVFTINYHEGGEILFPEQTHRIVNDNEIVYVKQGETMQLEAATSPYYGWNYWSSSNSSVGTISSTGVFTATACGSTTVTIDNGEVGSVRYEDAVTVYVVPVVPGEYYIETPLQSNRFIEPMTTVSANATLTVGALAEDEDNRLVLDFVPDDDFGYYTIKKIVKNGIVHTPWYLGAPSSTNGMEIRYFDDADTNGRWFDIEKNPSSGYYRITPRLSGQWNRSLAANASSPVGTKLTIQTYTQDTGFNDEWIFHRIMPLSGDEKKMGTDKWSQTGLPSNILTQANCYSYAVNAYYGTDNAAITDFSNRGEEYLSVLLNTEENIYEALRINAENKGFYIERIEKNEACPSGYYKIALFFESLQTSIGDIVSYHFYRQSVNGIWTHKLGSHRFDSGDGVTHNAYVTNLDASGKIIFDPVSCNRNVDSDQGIEILSDYPIFIGYYAINPGNVVQPTEN